MTDTFLSDPPMYVLHPSVATDNPEEVPVYTCAELAMLFDMMDSDSLLNLVNVNALPDCSKG
ncbi:MAG: hypothetical protein HQL84_16225 [Magnetococcales bacterium]|nr:hypothetical protein [Magnetococcales bacterium]MBF0151568.1 hypothetical protein [Magnetococcales bacterium]MBF0174562.1 hypothetical protein [Magnetococcales bacterium]MBF0347504.1 hypothetical protein [Magnetococcales bacterium]MBF0631744.1 hypothetical protein [Magnetococcales bacterium]